MFYTFISYTFLFIPFALVLSNTSLLPTELVTTVSCVNTSKNTKQRFSKLLEFTAPTLELYRPFIL